jgi:hypothetical protein
MTLKDRTEVIENWSSLLTLVQIFEWLAVVHRMTISIYSVSL